MFHPSRALLCLLFVLAPLPAQAQPKSKTQTITAKVKEVQEKGRAHILVVTTDDGKELSFPITPKVKFEAVGAGDITSLQPGRYLAGEATVSNNGNAVTFDTLTVQTLGPGQKAPPGHVKPLQTASPPSALLNSPAPPARFEISGEIIERGPSRQFQGYEQLALRLQEDVLPLLCVAATPVKTISGDVELARPDMPIELEVIASKGGDKFTLVRATINLAAAAAEPPKQ
jgi:hypothetical protein